jgi:membrane protein YqaA with SNARE-associated domain
MFKHALNLLLHKGHQNHDGINLRRWFLFYLLFLVALTTLALLNLFHYDRTDSSLSLRIWLSALYLFYLSLCCTFFPAPTTWIILLMASPIVALVEPHTLAGPLQLSESTASVLAALSTIFIVAALGALATAIANLNEYHIFTFLLRFGRVHKIRQTKFYRTAHRWFTVSPFAILALFGILPIPVDVVRWLAISSRYRRDHYAWANFLGRFVRYALLAAAATLLQIGWVGILVIQLTLSALVVLRFLALRRTRSAQDTQLDNPPTTDTVVSSEGVSP